jgi:putative solute:sodium symporter small subunit
MSDTNTDDPAEERGKPDGGTAAQAHENTDYLDREVNLLKPSTPFMREHLKLVWGGFVAWMVIVWGPVTLTLLAPDLMTTRMPMLGFPWHYFLVALGAPTGALVLAGIYARQRDKLDEKYDIDHAAAVETGDADGTEAPATDGGVRE